MWPHASDAYTITTLLQRFCRIKSEHPFKKYSTPVTETHGCHQCFENRDEDMKEKKSCLLKKMFRCSRIQNVLQAAIVRVQLNPGPKCLEPWPQHLIARAQAPEGCVVGIGTDRNG